MTGCEARLYGRRSDEGSVSILTLGWVVVVAMATLVVAVATDLHIQRMRLAAVADEIVLSAVGGDSAPYFAAGGGNLDAALVADVGRLYLTGYPSGSWQRSVSIVDTSAADGVSATVTLGREVPLLFHLDALAPWSGGIAITSTATARAS